MTSVDLTVYGANRPLHSGHYGNWSPNPGFRLIKLLSTMKDKTGRVLVDGWYDDVEKLSKKELEAIRNAPQYDEQLKKQLGVNTAEGGGKKPSRTYKPSIFKHKRNENRQCRKTCPKYYSFRGKRCFGLTACKRKRSQTPNRKAKKTH